MNDDDVSKYASSAGTDSESGQTFTLLSGLRQILTQLSQLHQAGRFHGNIAGDTIQEQDGQWLLLPPADFVTVGSPVDTVAEYPPDLDTVFPLTVPTHVVQGADVLEQNGIAVCPIRIDLFQLGSFVCRRVTGQSAQKYLSSPKTLAEVPEELLRLIDGALGAGSDPAFSTAEDFIRAIDETTNFKIGPRSAGNTGEGEERRSPVEARAGDSETTSNSETVPAPATGDDELPFRQLGHYRIVRPIGQGGMGDVYFGYEQELDRHVAVKVLPRELARDHDFEHRFRREAAAAARLSHPNIVQVFYAGEDAGHLFFAMQFVDGESLSDLLARRGALPVDQALPIVEQALSGLSHAHQQGMVHRDIKPGNLLIDHQLNRLLLADFGLVKSVQRAEGLTTTGTILGTAEYIAPEQGRGAETDSRSDLYSFGVVMYQMLCGRLPFSGENATAVVFQHVYERPEPLDAAVPPAVCRIVERLMAKNPEHRYASADAVLEDLRRYRVGTPLSEPPADSSAPKKLPAAADHRDIAQPASRVIVAPRFVDEPTLPESLNDLERAWLACPRERSNSTEDVTGSSALAAEHTATGRRSRCRIRATTRQPGTTY